MVDENIRVKVTAKDKASKVLKRVSSNVLAIGAAYLSWRAASGIIKSLTNAGLENEKAWNDISASLKRHGYEVEASLVLIQKQSDALQSLTSVSDELIGKGIQRLMDANFSLDDAIKTVSTSLDLAVGLTMDFRMVNELVAKSIDSSMNALTRYGIQIDKSKSRAEQVKELQAAVEGAFGGAAAARMDTTAGKLDLLQQTFGDVQERIGGAILKSDIFVTSIEVLTGVFKLLSPSIEDTTTQITELEESMEDFFAVEVDPNDLFAHLGKIEEKIEVVNTSFQDLVNSIESGSTATDKAIASFGTFKSTMGDVLTTLMGGIKEIKQTEEALDDLAEAAKQPYGFEPDFSRFDAILTRSKMTDEQLIEAHARLLLQLGMMDAAAAAKWLALEEKKISQVKTLEELRANLRLESTSNLDKLLADIDKQEMERRQLVADSIILTAIEKNQLLLEIEQNASVQRLEIYKDELDKQIAATENMQANIQAISSDTLNYISDHLLRPMELKSKEIFARMGQHFKRLFIDYITKELAKAIVIWLAKLAIFDKAQNDAMAMRVGRDYARFFSQGVIQQLDRQNLAGQLASVAPRGGAMPIPSSRSGAVAAGQPTTIVVQQYFKGNVMDIEFVRQTVIPATERAAAIGATKIALRPELITGNLDERFN